MSPKNSKIAETKPATGIPRTYLLTIGVVLVICIAVVAGMVLIKQGPWVPAVPVNTSVNTSTSITSAGELYSQSVDLANAGNYTGALAMADEALVQNDSSYTPLIQANRAGILKELGRYDEAIIAADIAINAPGNLTTLRSIAWYNKANAFSALGRTAEADAAYANATALDPTLKHP
jgi:tetratricopeptide (TPR) repeat protein